MFEIFGNRGNQTATAKGAYNAVVATVAEVATCLRVWRKQGRRKTASRVRTGGNFGNLGNFSKPTSSLRLPFGCRSVQKLCSGNFRRWPVKRAMPRREIAERGIVRGLADVSKAYPTTGGGAR